MKIVIFSHPDFVGSQSMARYTYWLAEGMRNRGHEVEVWKPEAFFCRLPCSAFCFKWLGYLDQYVVFPLLVWFRLRNKAKDILYVFSDHALGPWIPLVAGHLHIVHCHDFLAQRSALGEIPENLTGLSGRIYQRFIRRGYRKAKRFISISKKTQEDLHRFVGFEPLLSKVVYNGLTRTYSGVKDVQALRDALSGKTGLPLSNGFILHVGGNQWYKNRRGVVMLYDAWRQRSDRSLPLILVGQKPDGMLNEVISQASFKDDIFVVLNGDDVLVEQLYASASVFLFPSLAEGFGWPIVESMASGGMVITTNEAPMTEVGGNAAFYVRRMPNSDIQEWLFEFTDMLDKLLSMSDDERNMVSELGLENALRFNSDSALNEIERIYRTIVEEKY